ncbi:hypothetical protein P0082_02245 [Candidatus Haliotispira prima]|uniref:Uncharacterized protein n=1 Tax=Candidatus Haliotispira prima TaxID=3034016 RepID=A0ABY8MI54_9SPIO|nr:hypothetical protein P0082_02245 [Candidatus Haliotispira prima]
MNVRVYKKLYRELLEREHIGRLPETIFVEVRNYISSYAEKNSRVATSGRLRNGKQTFTTWLVRYHKVRVRKPSEEVLGYMQLLGILFLYVWHVEAKEGITDDFLVEEALKEFNRNREYRRTFELPHPPKRRGRPPLQALPVRRSIAKKATGRKAVPKKAAQSALRKAAIPKSLRKKIVR